MDQLNKKGQIDRKTEDGIPRHRDYVCGYKDTPCHSSSHHCCCSAHAQSSISTGHRTAVAAWLSPSPEDPHPPMSMTTLSSVSRTTNNTSDTTLLLKSRRPLNTFHKMLPPVWCTLYTFTPSFLWWKTCCKECWISVCFLGGDKLNHGPLGKRWWLL